MPRETDWWAPSVCHCSQVPIRWSIWLIGSAAERNYSATEIIEKRERVLRLNVQLPEFLGKITRERKILLIYISTGIVCRIENRLNIDYVFDGTNPPYYPDSKPKYISSIWASLTIQSAEFLRWVETSRWTSCVGDESRIWNKSTCSSSVNFMYEYR